MGQVAQLTRPDQSRNRTGRARCKQLAGPGLNQGLGGEREQKRQRERERKRERERARRGRLGGPDGRNETQIAIIYFRRPVITEPESLPEPPSSCRDQNPNAAADENI